MSISFFKIIRENLADRFERTGKVCYTDIENMMNLERDETMLDWIRNRKMCGSAYSGAKSQL